MGSNICIFGEVLFDHFPDGKRVLETAKKITYQINVKRVIMRKLVMGIADGILKSDGVPIYDVKDMRVGLFQEGS